MSDDPWQDENWRAAGAVAGKPVDDSWLTRRQFQLLAEHLTARLPGVRVQAQVTSQDTEGNWIWVDGEQAALWSDRYNGDVRYRMRVVSDWIPVR